MDPITDQPVEHNCCFCKKQFTEGERHHFSRQAGMQGLYHWDCFILACREVNRRGAGVVESALATTGLTDDMNQYVVITTDD
jgi:hypothetical protein